jgi:putative membrane protein
MESIIHLLVIWLISALALWIVAQVIPGIYVSGYGAALVATLAITLVNGTLGVIVKILTFPLTLVTLGLFLLVVNAVLLKLASLLVPGFAVRGFLSAFFGSIVLTLLTALLRHLLL